MAATKSRAGTIEHERRRRDEMWARWLEVPPTTRTLERMEELAFRPKHTGQGVFRDLERTRALAPDGLTLTLYAVDPAYDESFDARGGEYAYPRAEDRRSGGRRQAAEIAATKATKELGVPLFVVTSGAAGLGHCLHRAWVEGWDDKRRVFRLRFDEG